MRMFPVLLTSESFHKPGPIGAARKAGSPFVVVCVPWDMLEPHENQAGRNHGQTLERLAERGGLAASEILAVIEDRRWHDMSLSAANDELVRMVRNWLDGRACQPAAA